MKTKAIAAVYALLMSLVIYVYANPALQAPQFNNLGAFQRAISTKVPLAQYFFNQGLTLFYGFEWGESIRSFKEATRLDPNCAMCYWGLALALGNIMNAPLTGHEYSDAQAAIRTAIALKVDATPAEQDYIQALSLRFQHPPKISDAMGAVSCHAPSGKHDVSTAEELSRYSQAMQKIINKYPHDNNAKALYVYALFNRLSWDFWDSHGKINPLTPVIIKTLQAILATEPLNIAGNHYYIHVIEQSPHPEQALASAQRLKTLVPGSEHLVHMPTHIYFLTGRYHEASAANLQAIAVFKQYNKDCYAQGFKPEINYLYLHNYDFLRSTAIMEGRKKLALAAATQMLEQPFPLWLTHETNLQWFIPIPYFVKARFGMWQDLLATPMPKANYQYALGMWYYAHGMALAHTQQVKAAVKELTHLTKIIATKTENDFEKSEYQLLKIAKEILAATIANLQENAKATLMHLRLAAKIQHGMGYHEPPDWYFPLTEILGDAYLRWGYTQEAIAMYNKDLKQYPQNGWALYGLMQALRKQGKNTQANQVEQQFKEAWKYADLPSPVNIFAR